MQINKRVFESDYMLWSKTRPRARFDLAASGVPGYPLADLGVAIEDLEINGPGGYGYEPLRDAISDEYGVATECIVAGGGASGANAYACLLLLGPGDEALVEFPAYDILPNLARFTGAGVRRFTRNPADPDEVARLMTSTTKLIVLTNLHNPSSALIDELTLTRIGEIAARHGAHVLVDEAYLDCVWDRPPALRLPSGPELHRHRQPHQGLRSQRPALRLDLRARRYRRAPLAAHRPVRQHPLASIGVAKRHRLPQTRCIVPEVEATDRDQPRQFTASSPKGTDSRCLKVRHRGVPDA